MTERLQEILNRKPSKWGNLTVKEFEREIKLLQERVEELEKVEYALQETYRQEREYNKKLEQQNQRYKQALEYIQRAIYTQHCTKNHKWNSEFEKGQISGLIQASNIVDKAIRKVEGEV